MPIVKKFFQRVVNPARKRGPANQAAESRAADRSYEMPELAAKMGYHKLEPRQVLSASFNFGAGAGLLALDGFEADQDLTFSHDTGSDIFVFEIAGTDDWLDIGDADPGISFSGTTLEVDTALLTGGVTISGEDTIGITQSGSFAISEFSISNFSLTDQSIELDIDGNVTAGGLSVNDTLPADGIEASILLTATGSIDVTGDLGTTGANPLSAISLSATGATSDVTVDGAAITTETGSISLLAADDVSLTNSANVQAGLAGSVTLTANSDDATAVGATESILISDGSTVTSTTGDIDLAAIGDDGGDITLGSVSTGGDVTISATGNVVDGTAAEIANVIGTRVDVTGASIGSIAADGDLDIDVDNLSFNSAGVVNVTDLADGATVDATSSAGSGALTANSPLTISADVALAGSFTFTAGDSAVAGDHLTVDSNAIIALTAATNETVDFIAGDDLIFDTGRVVTTGGGVHTVNLTADNEGAGVIDADRGSVTNTAGAVTTVTTNNLVVNAAAGVGLVGNGLRTAVESLTVTNTVSDDVFICEADGVVLAGVSNVGRDIAVAAGGFINMTGAINAGVGDVRLVAGGDVAQTAGGIITANELGVRQTETVFAAGDNLDANTQFDIVLDANNDIDVFAAANLFDGGVIAIAASDDLTMGSVSSVTICRGVSFAATTGVTTTSVLATTGDVLVDAGDFLQLDESISAGAGLADVRLTADGLISQAVAGVIIANELGVRQEGVGNIELCEDNNVDVAAMFNADGDIHFQDVDGYLIGDVSAQTIDGVSFTAISGFTANSGDISFFSAGAFVLTGDVTATTVRIITSGDVTQTAGSLITAGSLGVRQEGGGNFDVLLGNANDVDVLAIRNDSDGGRVVFNDVDDLTVGSVAAFAFCGHAFAATTGVTTTFTAVTGTGDVLINADGFLQLEESISAGAGLADVRLVADGDIHQAATSAILANELGVRQEATVFVAANNRPSIPVNSRFDVVLDGVNDVDQLAVSNAFDGGLVAFNDVDDLTVAVVSTQTIDGVAFGTTTGVTTTFTGPAVTGDTDTAGDVLVNSDGFLRLDETISAGADLLGAGLADVRLTADGLISQAVAGVIIANELGVRQEAVGNIELCEDNNVDVASMFNADGDIHFQDVDGYLIGDVSAQTIDGVSFAATSGFTANSGDISFFSAGAFELNGDVTATTVRIIASGDITQTTGSVITADILGVRQEGTVLGGNFDVLLGNANDVGVLAIRNDSDGGRIVFNDVDDLTVDLRDGLTVGSVTELDFCGHTFEETAGVTTTFTAVVGTGDVLINADDFLRLDETVNAGLGLADVRLMADGDISQAAAGVIIANELGVRQETVGNIELCEDNNVDVASMFNDDGDIHFEEVDGYVIGDVSAQTIAGVTFDATTAFLTNSGDISFFSAGDFNLTGNVTATTVHIIANGDVTQTGGVIVAGMLGVRQEGLNILDGFTRFDILLGGANDVGDLAAFNASEGGVIVFNDTDGLTVGSVTAFAFCGHAFAATTGVTTTFTAVTGTGDVLINADGFLQLDESISAGAGLADVRLVADGDIHQAATSAILANELGVRQEATVFSAGNDLPVANSRFDVVLDGVNEVDRLAVSNVFDGGAIAFNNDAADLTIQNLTVASVAAQTINGVSFTTTTGIVSTFTGVSTPGAGDVADGDILIDTDGFLQLNEAVVAGAGAADVRLTTDGDVVQAAAGTITANELGIRQTGTVFNASSNLVTFLPVSSYDVVLDDGNDVDFLAISNVSDAGVVVFNDVDDLTIAVVSAQAIDGASFVATTGLATTYAGAAVAGAGDVVSGDVLVSAGQWLNIENSITAGDGNADVRLVANGDLHQSETGLIFADELGARQEESLYSVAGDLDGNGQFDIVLCYDNEVLSFSADNQFDGGNVLFHSVLAYAITDVSTQTIGNVTYAATTGVTSAGGGSLFLQASDGGILISTAIDVGSGTLYLLANGDVLQEDGATITANGLAIRQNATVVVPAADLDGSGGYEIILASNNVVSEFTAANAFADGVIAFRSIENLAIVDVPADIDFCGKIFEATDGIQSEGDILIETAGALAIENSINADGGLNDVRLIASGDVSQLDAGIITAGFLGVRQEGIGDVVLCAENRVDTFAASNPAGDLHFHNSQALVIGAVSAQTIANPLPLPGPNASISFTATTGVTVSVDAVVSAAGSLLVSEDMVVGNDIFLLAEPTGSITLDANLVATNDVRLVSNGDIVQNAGGEIFATQLGVRQQSVAGGDIILDDGNDVDVFSAFNAFDDGLTAFNDIDGLAVATVDGVTSVCGDVFAVTAGIDTRGDILVQVAGDLIIEEEVNADDRANDVRLIAGGTIMQTETGIIVAGELGTRAAGDTILCFDNRINEFSAVSTTGQVHIHDALTSVDLAAFQVESVAAQTIGNIMFVATAGITAGADTLVSSATGLAINNAIVATDARLLANGSVTQAAAISVNQLGVRQENVGADLDILLDAANDVNELAIFNASEGGKIAFNDIDDLAVEMVASLDYCGKTFATTTGIVSTFVNTVLDEVQNKGVTDVDSGDVLIEAGGFLQINQSIIAGVDSTDATNRGHADARLIANGDVAQTATGTIFADELGVRQESVVGVSHITLGAANEVERLAAINLSDNGYIAFNDTDEAANNNAGLTVDQVVTQTQGNLTFTATTGLETQHSGVALFGDGSVAGDILIKSDSTLTLNQAVSAGGDSADVRLMADGDITQGAAGEISADELGVRQQSLDGNIQLTDVNNEVNHLSMLNLDPNDELLAPDGALSFVDSDDLTINRVSGQTIGAISYAATNGVVSFGAGAISMEATGQLDDGIGVAIITNGDALFETHGPASKILLTNQATDQLTVGGNVTFQSEDIEVGQDSVAAGNGNVLLDTVTILDDDDVTTLGTNTADITADSTMVLTAASAADRLVLTSSANITNTANAQLLVNEVQFNAAGNVFIGNQDGDLFQHSTGAAAEIILGVVAANASIAADSSLELNGNIPVIAADVNRPHAVVANEFELGTAVTGTLFATSTGHIEQSIGALNAFNLGLDAATHVHLDRVSSLNETIAIHATDSSVVNTQQATLNSLAAVSDSEVNATLDQSISVVHQGQLTVDQVNNPDGSPLAAADLVGVTTDGNEDGSILLVAATSIAINENVSATSDAILPQVTTYVTTGAANDASRITFGGGSLMVSGVLGAEANQGVVNDSQTTAFFGVDTDGDGDIDQFLSGTTQVVRLQGTGTAEQLIRGQYGSPGEDGYRLAFVWDSQRRFEPGFTAPQEIPNLYTDNATATTEPYDVTISDQDAVGFVSTNIANGDFTRQTDLVEDQNPDGGVFNFNTLFAKRDPFTQDAINVRRDDVRVFTTIEVRNDQGINLFVGPLASLDNSLNSATFVLEAALETSGVQTIQPAAVFFLNTILPEPEIVEPYRQIRYMPIFEQREFRRLDDPGTLSYVAVKIGALDGEDYAPEEFIIEIDGELILKDPTANYEPLNDDAKPEKLEANKNEIAAIIAQIEADPNAEAGLWYKIFVDYEDGSGKKDKVLFYHFKTGERPSEELGPESDFDNNVENDPAAGNVEDEDGEELELELNPPTDAENTDGADSSDSSEATNASDKETRFLPSDSPRLDPASLTSPQNDFVAESFTEPLADSLSASSRLGLSAGTLLLATMAAKRKQQPTGHAPFRQSNQQTSLPPDPELSFSRFDRLKRRVATLMGRE